MACDLRGKVLLITGASSGIGAATAILAGRAAMTLALAARRADRLEQVARQVRDAGGKTLIIPTDVADPLQVRAMVQQTLDAFGCIDVLFANAGFGYFGPTLSNPDIERQIWLVNYLGTTEAIAAVLPIMRRQRSGHILVNSSILSRVGLPYYGAYTATKAAQHALLASLRLELEPENIAVSGIYPAGTSTEYFQSVARVSGNDAISANTPKIFMQRPEKVARHILACIRRPRPEVWPSTFGRFMAVLWTAFPRFACFCFRFHARRCRKTLAQSAPPRSLPSS